MDSSAIPSRPFPCHWHKGCSKSFNRKSDLQRHFRIHTNERPYACDFPHCDKTFIQRSALTVHKRTHTGDKPHKCSFGACGKCFSDSSSLARHRRIHTNDKPYICKVSQCQKARTTMIKHCRKEHADEFEGQLSDDDGSEDEATTDRIPSTSTSSSHDWTVPKLASYDANLWRLPAQASNSTTPNSTSGNEMSSLVDETPSFPPQNFAPFVPRNSFVRDNPFVGRPVPFVPTPWSLGFSAPPPPGMHVPSYEPPIMPPPPRQTAFELTPESVPNGPGGTYPTSLYNVLQHKPAGNFDFAATTYPAYEPSRGYGEFGTRAMEPSLPGSFPPEIDIFKELKADAVYGQLPEHASYDI